MTITTGWSRSLSLKRTGRHDSGDYDGDADVDLGDLAELVGYWLQNEPAYDIAPSPAPDGIINMCDLAVLAESWQMGIAPLSRWCFDGDWARQHRQAQWNSGRRSRIG